MRTILRQTIHEQFWQRQVQEIVELCRKTGIEEVMLMEQSHQIVMVPFPIEKHRKMAEIYQKMADIFTQNGIEYSVNIATIVGHSDAPVDKAMQLPFQKFVGEDLQERTAIYCISDSEWVKYAQTVVSLYAQTHPKRIMIDDDFRSLNHTMAYGCFCSKHVHDVSQALNLPLTSPSLFTAIKGTTDQDLKIRQTWQTINFDYQLKAAHAIESAIHHVDPTIQVGLMNSGEPAHSVQGRDMKRLLAAFAGPNMMSLSRPAGGVYADSVHQPIVNMHQMSALSVHMGDNPTFWVSEVENWPHSLYIKSAALTSLQIKMHALWGADAISLNLFDYLGTPIPMEPKLIEVIQNVKQDATWIQEQRKDKVLTGISIPFKAHTSGIKTDMNQSLEGIMPNRLLDNILPILGIPTQFAEGECNVIVGDDIQAYRDDEVKALLKKSLLIDNKAAEHLMRRGFASFIGCQFDHKITEACVEKLSDPSFSGSYTDVLLPTNWFRQDIQGDWISYYTVDQKAKVISHLVDMEMQDIAPATLLYENEWGGRICIFAQGIQELAWLHKGRAQQLKAIFPWLLKGETLPLLSDFTNIAPFYYVNPNTQEKLLALVNTGLDVEVVDVSFLKGWELKEESLSPRIEMKVLDIIFLTQSR